MSTTLPPDSEQIALVVDVKLRRPACVLLQACMGGDNHFVSGTFQAKHWLIAPTPDMHLVKGTREQWKKFSDELDRQPDKRAGTASKTD
jgi:hypothetical protein